MLATLNSPATFRSPRPTDNGRRTHHVDQFEFNWQFPHQWPLVNVSEVSELFRCSERQVRELAEAGRFLSFAINHDAEPQREHLRIVRNTVNRDLRSVVIEDWRMLVEGIDGWLFPHSRQVLTPKETALALRCFPSHVRELCGRQELRVILIGRGGAERDHVRIERASVTRFVRRRIEMKIGFDFSTLNSPHSQLSTLS